MFKIMPPLHSSPIILSPVANYHSNYKTSGISYPDIPGLNYKLVRMYGGIGSNIIIPVTPHATIMFAQSELGVITKRKIMNTSLEECYDSILGFTCAINIHLQELRKYYMNASLSSIRSFKVYTIIGPWIVNPSVLTDYGNLDLCLSYGDVILQHGNTSDMVQNTCELMRYMSQGVTVHGGSLILTGAPEPNKFSKMAEYVEIHDGKPLVASVEKVGFVNTILRLVTSSEISDSNALDIK